MKLATELIDVTEALIDHEERLEKAERLQSAGLLRRHPEHPTRKIVAPPAITDDWIGTGKEAHDG